MALRCSLGGSCSQAGVQGASPLAGGEGAEPPYGTRRSRTSIPSAARTAVGWVFQPSGARVVVGVSIRANP
jgi:hypothetical protein